MNQCLAVSGIAGVQPDGPSRLVLFMRDQRIVSASLEKACNAQDFYSGFLVERTSDGMICSGRDELLSRSGSHCSLGKLRQLVQINPAVSGIRRTGSASTDLAWLAAGRFDGYWEAGLKPWDVAPGWLMLREARGTITD